MMLLKKHLVELVRRGRKRQTIRLWTRAMVCAGGVSYTPGLGRMRITAVDELAGLGALTRADAVADGFGSLRELLGEIERIYGGEGVPAGRRVYRVRFEWPIDEAGERLVMKGKGRGVSVVMSVAQRRALRGFVMSRAPR